MARLPHSACRTLSCRRVILYNCLRWFVTFNGQYCFAFAIFAL